MRFQRNQQDYLAFNYTQPLKKDSLSFVFLSGFSSNMQGEKVTQSEAWAKVQGHEYLRFDYFGHGESSGEFVDGCISDWLDDSVAIFDAKITKPAVLIGSSMGGWLALLLALLRPEKVKGLVLIAPAPDFTEDLMWEVSSDEQQRQLNQEGVYHHCDAEGNLIYSITKKLIDDGRSHLLLRDKIKLNIPVHILHGMQDDDVPWERSILLMRQLQSEQVDLELVKDAGHRFSRPEDLQKLLSALQAMAETLTNRPA